MQCTHFVAWCLIWSQTNAASSRFSSSILLTIEPDVSINIDTWKNQCIAWLVKDPEFARRDSKKFLRKNLNYLVRLNQEIVAAGLKMTEQLYSHSL